MFIVNFKLLFILVLFYCWVGFVINEFLVFMRFCVLFCCIFFEVGCCCWNLVLICKKLLFLNFIFWLYCMLIIFLLFVLCWLLVRVNELFFGVFFNLKFIILVMVFELYWVVVLFCSIFICLMVLIGNMEIFGFCVLLDNLLLRNVIIVEWCWCLLFNKVKVWFDVRLCKLVGCISMVVLLVVWVLMFSEGIVCVRVFSIFWLFWKNGWFKVIIFSGIVELYVLCVDVWVLSIEICLNCGNVFFVVVMWIVLGSLLLLDGGGKVCCWIMVRKLFLFVLIVSGVLISKCCNIFLSV